MDRLYRHRRFGLAVAITLASIGALYTGRIGGGEFIALSATVLGMYGGIVDKENNHED
jgi:hypothetical protein